MVRKVAQFDSRLAFGNVGEAAPVLDLVFVLGSVRNRFGL